MDQNSTTEGVSTEENKDNQQEVAVPDTAKVETESEVQNNQEGKPDKNISIENNILSTETENGKIKTKEKKEQVEDYGKQFEGAELWEQIRKHTKNIEIEEDEYFYWPERREYTERIIQQLLVKRILFIRSASEDWLYPAVQRLASMLQANGKLENLLLRITKSHLSIDNSTEDKLEFGFWVNQRKLPFPVVIFISADRQDFIQKFLSLSKETIRNEVLTDLKKANLFIVCEAEESIFNRDLFDSYKKRRNETFAIWQVPCVKLHINKYLKEEGDFFLNQLIEKGIVKDYDEQSVYEGLIKIDLEAETEVTGKLCEKLQQVGSDIENKKKLLIDIMESEDFTRKVVVFCGAFFNGLYYPDFHKLVSTLLVDEKKDSEDFKQAVNPQGVTSSLISSLSLSEMWTKNADRILKSCFLETKKEEGNIRVGFKITQLSDIIINHIEEKQYPFFYRVYKNFEETGLLTNTDLSEKLEIYVIQFFAIAAKMDTSSHNAKWLKNVVYGLWKLYETNLPTNTSYDELLRYLKRENKIAPIIFNRIPLIIGGLLRNGNEHFKDIIKDFFRLLLNEPDAKKMAIIIASYLYKEYRFTDTFSTDDLVSYFRRTLDEGNWEESFFAYDALIENMSYQELYQQTKEWIEDKKIADGSWTKQFSFLYQINFILITVYRYFRQFKSEVAYELWETTGKEYYPESFNILIKDLLSERCFKSLELIFNNPIGYKRFIYFVRLFESVESGKRLEVDRFDEENNEPYTLIADVLETWFNIMTLKQPLLRPDSTIEDKWREYVKMIISYCDAKYLRLIRKYWATKQKFYSVAIEDVKVETRDNRRKINVYAEQLKKRRNNLKMLIHLLQITDYKLKID